MVTISIDYDFKNLDDVLYWLDGLYVKYDIPFGLRESLEILACRKIVKIDSSKSKVIENILKAEGFKYIVLHSKKAAL